MKHVLRKEIKKQTAGLSREEKQRLSDEILCGIEQLPEFKKAKNILLFWSLPDEVFTHNFLEKWHKQKCLLLPAVNGDELELKHYEGGGKLQAGAFGICEPQGKLFTEWDKIDMALVPGVAFDCNQNRLGRGKGYYDKLLPKISGTKIGVCFPCQLVESVPCQEWDVKMDFIVSFPSALHRRGETKQESILTNRTNDKIQSAPLSCGKGLGVRCKIKKYAIIVAGGKGLRMNAELPKQFIPVNGKPLLMLTMKAFFDYDNDIELILVLPDSQQEYWQSLCRQYEFTLAHTIANGGETRFHSVQNGLKLVPDAAESLVAIHDGVRPFVSRQTISKAFDCAGEYGSAIPAIDPVDSVRCLTTTGSEALDRTKLKMVQTPQIFKTSILKKAYLQPFSPSFTDDASVVEKCGHPICLTEGNRENIKITTPFDLLVAEALV